MRMKKHNFEIEKSQLNCSWRLCVMMTEQALFCRWLAIASVAVVSFNFDQKILCWKLWRVAHDVALFYCESYNLMHGENYGLIPFCNYNRIANQQNVRHIFSECRKRNEVHLMHCRQLFHYYRSRLSLCDISNVGISVFIFIYVFGTLRDESSR